MSSVRIGIENAIRSMANQSIYPTVKLNKITDQIEEGSLVSPTFFMVKEVGGSWARDNRFTRDLKYERTQWTFQLKMIFIQEVNLEAFENILEDGYNIKSNTFGIHGPVLLEPVSSNIAHPVEQAGSSQGTEAIYLIKALIRH